MADKQVTVAVPAERVPEFYAWFAAFLAVSYTHLTLPTTPYV